jgi:hypothetical protein
MYKVVDMQMTITMNIRFGIIIYVKYGHTIDSRVDWESMIGWKGVSLVRRETEMKFVEENNVEELPISMHHPLPVCTYPLSGCGGENIWTSSVSSTMGIFSVATHPYISHAVRCNQAPPASLHDNLYCKQHA